MSFRSNFSSWQSKSAQMQLIELAGQKILHAVAYDCLANFPALQIMDARHCYLVIGLQNGKQVVFERNQNSFTMRLHPISEQRKKDNKISNEKYEGSATLINLYNAANRIIKRSGSYKPIVDNCFDFVINLCEYLNLKQLKKKIIDQKNKTMDVVIQKGAAILRTPFAYADAINKTSNLLSKGVTGAVGNLSVVTAVGSQAVQEFYKCIKDPTPQNIVRSSTNVVVGSVGALAGIEAGALLGAQIGLIGGPIGLAIGAGIGSIVGGIAGSNIKKILPWNW